MKQNLILSAAVFVLLIVPTISTSESGSVEKNEFAFNAKLLPTNPRYGAIFGHTVAISGDTAVIGSPHDQIGNNKKQGSVYVFVKREGVWSCGKFESVAENG